MNTHTKSETEQEKPKRCKCHHTELYHREQTDKTDCMQRTCTCTTFTLNTSLREE